MRTFTQGIRQRKKGGSGKQKAGKIGIGWNGKTDSTASQKSTETIKQIKQNLADHQQTYHSDTACTKPATCLIENVQPSAHLASFSGHYLKKWQWP
jgi:hypothetical protein